MLIRFSASNFRSVADQVELSLVAIDDERDAARDQPLLREHLLTRSAIYGPNASGKSNVVAALAWLRHAVAHSLRLWEDRIPVEPFAFGVWARQPSRFELGLTIDGVRHEYVLEVTDDHVEYEALFEYPERRPRKLFEREAQELTFGRGVTGLSQARALMTPRTLALSTIRRFEDDKVSPFVRELLSLQVVGLQTRGRSALSRERLDWHGFTRDLFDESRQPGLFATGTDEPEVEDRAAALAMLRLADLGIDDVRFVDEAVVVGGRSRNIRRLQLVHRAGDVSVPLEFEEESEGTRTWFRLLGPVVTALRRGTVVVVDELDASLHPTLSAEVLALFESRTTNPLGAQLIFTGHDTSLLDNLNRDELWLTEKRPSGSTNLGPLSEFAGERVRTSTNLPSGYLHGRFGAIPEVDRSALLRALGLIA